MKCSMLIPAALVLCVATEARAQFETARALYKTVESVHMQADVQIKRDGVVGAGSYEYWAHGDNYRINCATDAKLGLVGDIQYAYDGTQFQFLNRAGDSLTINREGDAKQLATAIPNPFFLPVDYLSPNDDACPGCPLRLRDLKSESPKIYTTRARGGIALTLRTSGRTIEWLRKDGSASVSISLDRPVSREFPRRIVVRDFDERGQESMEMVFLIRVLELNTGIEPTIFEIPLDAASRVYDDIQGHAYRRQ